MKDWYIELTKGPWRFMTTKKVSFYIGKALGESKVLYEMYHKSRKWATLHGGWLTIEQRYASDGCTPGTRIMGKWVGVPTFNSMIPAVFVHDVLSQFKNTEGAPWTDDQASDAFLYMMLAHGTPACRAQLYYNSVRSILGKAFRGLSEADPDCHIRQIRLL